jgi:hypothetical protein
MILFLNIIMIMPTSQNHSNFAFRFGLQRLATTPTAKSGFNLTFRISLIVAAVIMFLTATINGCGMRNQLTMVSEEFPRASACGHCHIDIFDEWSASPHARAYTSLRYREATDGYRFSACLGCHAPEPALTDIPPSPRATYRDEGVTCVSCHLEEGRLSGPIRPSGMVSPHPIDVDSDQYRHSRFCGRCHEGTFAEWSTVEMEDKPSCQKCHMPQKRRKITQPAGTLSKLFVSFEKNVMQKRHTFATVPEALENQPYSVKAAQDAKTVTLAVTNHLPHSLPPGDFGMRIVLLKVFIVAAKGKTTLLGKRELIRELGSAIPPLSSLVWKLILPADARSLRVEMVRSGHEDEEISTLMETEIILL